MLIGIVVSLIASDELYTILDRVAHIEVIVIKQVVRTANASSTLTVEKQAVIERIASKVLLLMLHLVLMQTSELLWCLMKWSRFMVGTSKTTMGVNQFTNLIG